MKLAIGCDHGGVALKREILSHLDQRGTDYEDFGIHTNDPCDYPDIALPVCRSVLRGGADRGILICGTGIGISMAANKIHGIRAALCHDCFSAKYTRLHNDANILALGARVIGPGLALEIVDLFLTTGFEGGRHAARVDKMMALEEIDL